MHTLKFCNVKNKIVESLIFILILALGILGFADTLHELVTENTVSIIKPNKVFSGPDLWKGLAIQFSVHLGLISMGIMMVLCKLKFIKAGLFFASIGMLLFLNWFIFLIFII